MAGNLYKGITISFEGDTTKLDKALRKINDSTKSIDKELKQVNNALKFNPTSVELWRQKQQLLTEKVAETKSKLDVLKQAQAQMDADGVDKTSKEYRELSRQIITTESQVKNFTKQLKEVGNVKLKALSEQFKQVGTKLQSVGEGMTKYITGPIVGIGAASVKAFGEVKDGLNIVAQKTGATGKELTAMQDSARELAKTLPTTFTDAGIAVGELNTRFGVTGKELEDLGKQYIKFAKVNGVDLNTSIDDTQKALAAFGKSAKDAPKLLDTLTKAGQLTGASVDDLTTGLIQNGTAFQELGLGINSSVLLMAQLEKSGANSETVMNGLRKALKNATAEGIPLDQALANLQTTIENGSGTMDGLTASYELFGKSGDQIYGAVKNGTINFKELAIAAGETSGTLDSVFNETLTPAEKFQTTLNSVKDAGYQIGSTIMKVLEPAMNALSEKMQSISDWWKKLSPEQQKAITKIAMITATIGPLLIIIGKVATAIGGIINLINVIGPAIGLLSSGTLLPIIAVIAAVVAAGVLLYKNWDKIKAVAKNVAEAVKNSWNKLKTSVSNIMDKVKTTVSNAWEKLKTTVSNTAQSIYDKLTWPFSKAWELIDDVAEWIKDLFPIDIGALFDGIELPHLSIEWTEVTALGKTVKFPSGFDIDWYKNGGIFSSPSIIGVGEAGSEAVVPLDKFWNKLDNLTASAGAPVINIYPTPYQDAKEIAKEVEKVLVQQQRQKAAAYGNI